MTTNYTNRMEKIITNYPFPEQSKYALEDLKTTDFFRSFCEGLMELMQRTHHATRKDSPKTCAEQLYEQLQNIGSSLKRETVLSWFSNDAVRPKIEPSSRREIYEICFALGCSLEETQWFFHHVYFDRSFNCHNIEEAVYFFCFLQKLSYSDAQDMIMEIKNYNAPAPSINTDTTHLTFLLMQKISSFSGKKDFLHFIKKNLPVFDSWNKSSVAAIRSLLNELTGADRMSTEDIKKKIKEPLRKKWNARTSSGEFYNDIDVSMFKDCGLLLKEICYDAFHDKTSASTPLEYIYEAIDNKSVLKNSFVLDRLTTSTAGIPKRKELPYVLKVNFPSKKSFSDILRLDSSGHSGIETAKNYDMIRKTLVLLQFYTFWIPVKIKDTLSGYCPEERFQIYREEANDCLVSCGYEPLFAGNPYDWLFLVSANNNHPTAFLRECLSELVSSEDTL